MTTAPATDTDLKGRQYMLIHEELARARMRDVREEAAAHRLAVRVAAARRWQRRADAAARRARAAREALG